MERTAVNPWSWPVPLGFDQAQLVEGQRRVLICSGQDAVDADVDTLLQHSPVLTRRFQGTGERFASTLLGVAHLAGPGLLVALEATAMD
jgi:hypothetical protein